MHGPGGGPRAADQRGLIAGRRLAHRSDLPGVTGQGGRSPVGLVGALLMGRDGAFIAGSERWEGLVH